MTATEALVEDLRRVGAGRVDDDVVTRSLYATDASLYEVMPRAVLRAARADDLNAAVDVAARHGIPITARGAGTSLAGQAVGPGLIVDCTALGDISIDPDAATAVVGPGVVLEALNRAAAPHGLWFGPDTATADRCTLGGMIGNNSCGARSLLYGMTADHVLGLSIVAGSGAAHRLQPIPRAEASRAGVIAAAAASVSDALADEIRRRYPSIPRRASGYNLDRLLGDVLDLPALFVGSEGSFGLIRDATVGLVHRPAISGATALHFPEMAEALTVAHELLALGPASVELIDRTILDLAARSPSFARSIGWVRGRPEAILLVEFMSDDDAEVAARLDEAERTAGTRAETVRLAGGEREHAWRIRKAGLPLLYSGGGSRKPVPFVEDVAVAPADMPGFIDAFRDIVARAGTTAAFYAHAGAGCLHVRPMLDPTDAVDRAALASIRRQVADEASRLGGAMSGEHGDGRARSDLLRQFFGDAIVEGFAEIKRAFDPDGLMNPGIIVDPVDPMASFRTPAAAGSVRSVLHHPEGLAAAADRCFGAGVCLHMDGSMCPSYMVTAREEDSTRARANVLRSVMSGTVPPQALDGGALDEAMDLCIGCKACKAECPAGVDVAALRTEYLAARPKTGARGIRARLFGALPSLAKAASTAPALANRVLAGAVGRRALRRIGVDGPVPSLAPVRFSRAFARRAGRGSGEPVTVFVDTFVEYFEPEVGVAAVTVLEAAGYEVSLITGECCGRTALSAGAIDRARTRAERTARALGRANGPIVFLEPSCLSAVTDDYPLLGVGTGAPVVGFDDLVAAERDRFAHIVETAEAVTLHVHCHQRALSGPDAAAATMDVAGGATITSVSCCGMAGSFGFESEHAEVSRAMAERSVIPAARAAPGPVVAAGTSCRQQIARHASVRAMHPAELLRQRLRGSPGGNNSGV